MASSPKVAPISGKVTVGVPLEQAFRVFTASVDTWWPHQYHIGQADVAEAIHGAITGGGGWVALLDGYAKLADKG